MRWYIKFWKSTILCEGLIWRVSNPPLREVMTEWWGCVGLESAPAVDGAVLSQSARVGVDGTDCYELAGRRSRLAIVIEAPTGEGAVGLDPAGVDPSGAGGDERPEGRGCFAIAIASPAGDGPVRLDPAGVAPSGADRDKGPGERGRLAIEEGVSEVGEW